MATYIRLTDYKDSESKKEGFFKPENRYDAKQEDFAKIPGSPIAYWVSEKFKLLMQNQKISKFAFSDGKNVTGDNDTYLKQIWEVNQNSIGQNKKWFFMMKGGEYRRWYGNIEHIIDFDDTARMHYKKSKIGRLIPEYLWFKKGITWSKISSKNASFRLLPEVCTFDEVNITLNSDDDFLYINSFLNTNIAKYFLESTNQTLSFQTENILSLPILFPKQESTKHTIDTLTQQNIDISKEEWDSRETSWDFKTNGLLCFTRNDGRIENAYNDYCDIWREKFYKLHANEEELNRLFIDIYELQDELTPDVELKDITILKQEADIVDGELVFNAGEIMKQFISYAVGCMFGRYSLDHDGLWIANLGQYEEEIASEKPRNDRHSKQSEAIHFKVDEDNVIPILDGEWFIDDISQRLFQFVKVTFGSESYEANLDFIANALSDKNKNSVETIRKYFLKYFYADHVKRYKKRPIYWLFSSPKGSFQALIYMHRYKSDTVSVVLNDYLREFITKLEATRENLEALSIKSDADGVEKTKALKEIENIKKMIKELREYEKDVLYPLATRKLEIDLDDGVKVNYPKFGMALKKIVGLDSEE